MSLSIKDNLKRKLSPRALRFLQSYNHYRLLQVVTHALGYDVFPLRDCYSPLPSRKQLHMTRQRWYRPSSLRGVNYSIERMSETLTELLQRYRSEIERLPSFNTIANGKFGSGYNELDALLLYMM